MGGRCDPARGHRADTSRAGARFLVDRLGERTRGLLRGRMTVLLPSALPQCARRFPFGAVRGRRPPGVGGDLRELPSGTLARHSRRPRAADLAGAHRVVDLGCGTGDQATAIARRLPGAEVNAVDASPLVIIGGRHQGAGIPNLKLEQGFAEETGSDDASVDTITITLVFHECPSNHQSIDHALRYQRPSKRSKRTGSSNTLFSRQDPY